MLGAPEKVAYNFKTLGFKIAHAKISRNFHQVLRITKFEKCLLYAENQNCRTLRFKNANGWENDKMFATESLN